MKQTAVDWLESLYDSRPAYEEYISPEEFEHAREIEKKRMIEFAFNFYYNTSNMNKVPFNLISENRFLAEDYYNETFNTKKK
jgi:hypothetical protein